MKNWQINFCVVKEAKTIYKSYTNATSVQKSKIWSILKFLTGL